MSLLRTELRAARAAVMFFTRLPVPSSADWEPDDLRRSAAYFPAVGWLVGGVAAFVWWLGSLIWPPLIASGVSLAATLLLTGAFHEDGWADVCDGFGGGMTRDRVLEIMHDSRVGAFGAIGVVMMLGLKWHSVAALPAALVPAALVAGHALSRAASASLMASLSYVRADSIKAKPMATDLSGARLGLALVSGLVPMLWLPWSAGWAVLAVIVARGACELIFYLVLLAVA
ncbi:MAG: adenosylcobinamide-GDP ribazoletransferase [Verrucomicrobia bacterium]|nr:adenosylcobinamide-GDP ribazoletransferase [Verrucomicrobiota bacterium]